MVWCATSAHLFGWMLPISCTDLVCSWIIKLIWMSVKWDCIFLLKLFCVAHSGRTFIWLLLKFFASVRGFIQLIPLDHSKIKSPKWGIALIYVALSNKVFLVLLGFVLREKNPKPTNQHSWNDHEMDKKKCVPEVHTRQVSCLSLASITLGRKLV